MVVKMEELRVVLFAIHVAAAQGATLDPQGDRTKALWDALLPLSLPEPGDPPLIESWAALVKLSEMYAQLVDQPSGPRQDTRIGDDIATVSGTTWH